MVRLTMVRLTWSATVSMLVLLVWTDSVYGQATDMINTFEVNWNLGKEKDKESRLSELSPPKSAKSNYSWVARKFGPCFGCGSKSYKELKHDCVHKLPMQLTAGTFSKAMVGVFRVADSECQSQSVPPVKGPMGCGPPCSELRLLRGESTGCRCDHSRKLAYDVPKLVCQDNRNRSVSLSLCKFFYERSTDYRATPCDYEVVCSRRPAWIQGKWSSCTDENSSHQVREVICAVQSTVPPPDYYFMHESMCPAETRPPKLQFCARWASTKRFPNCNCATRKASRKIVCLRRGSRTALHESECSWHPKPNSERTCDNLQLEECKRSSRKQGTF